MAVGRGCVIIPTSPESRRDFRWNNSLPLPWGTLKFFVLYFPCCQSSFFGWHERLQFIHLVWIILDTLYFQLMKLMAVRRVQIAQSGKSDVPLPPAPPPHPGYAPNAALHAIKRHAVEFVSPKELAVSCPWLEASNTISWFILSDARREGRSGYEVDPANSFSDSPQPSHILLPRQIVSFSSSIFNKRPCYKDEIELIYYFFLHLRRLRAYESHLSTVALSNVESSRTVSQILFDLANSNDFQQ